MQSILSFLFGHPVTMRTLSLASLLLVLVHCGAPPRLPPALIISLDARPQVRVQGEANARIQGQAAVEVDARVEAEAQAEAEVQVQVEARPQVRTPAPPPPPPTAVPLEQAEVVEFFGIPLDDAQDVVFVLDRSGSMAASAQGRIAQLGASAAPPAEADTPAPAPASSDGHGEEPAPEAPAADEGAPEGSAEPGPEEPAEEPAEAPEPPPPPSKIEVAHRELVEALERLPAGTRVNVLYFNDELEAFSATLFPLEDQSRVELIDFVMKTEPAGATALGPAMRTAFLMNARRIVLLSDGLGNVGGGAHAVLRDAREAMRGGVRIDTIGLGYGQDDDLLRSMAHESGGLYQGL
jgi:Mg-chelatase subunit ChlD